MLAIVLPIAITIIIGYVRIEVLLQKLSSESNECKRNWVYQLRLDEALIECERADHNKNAKDFMPDADNITRGGSVSYFNESGIYNPNSNEAKHENLLTLNIQ